MSSDEPDLLSLFPEAESGSTVTILFTDIVDSTRSAERIGDRRWLEVLRAHNALVRGELRRQQGVEVKARGDGFMLAFAGARRAVQCAVAIQRALAAEPIELEPGDPVEVRIGVHTGEALQAEHDLFGRHVNLAARIADRAGGGEVLVSALTRDLLFGADDLVFGSSEEVQLKGVAGAQMLVPVLWRTSNPSVPNDVDGAPARRGGCQACGHGNLTSRGSSSATESRSRTKSSARAISRPSSSCRRGRSCIRGCGRDRSAIWPGITA